MEGGRGRYWLKAKKTLTCAKDEGSEFPVNRCMQIVAIILLIIIVIINRP